MGSPCHASAGAREPPIAVRTAGPPGAWFSLYLEGLLLPVPYSPGPIGGWFASYLESLLLPVPCIPGLASGAKADQCGIKRADRKTCLLLLPLGLRLRPSWAPQSCSCRKSFWAEEPLTAGCLSGLRAV